MALSSDIVSQFAKMTNKNKPKPPAETTVKGTYKNVDGEEFVQIDGSEIWTPVKSTVEAETGERVNVLIKNHSATVTGNISSPSARSKSVSDLKDEVDEYGNTIQQLDNSIKQQANSIIQMNNAINQQNNTINQHGNTINQQNNAIQQLNNTIIEQNDTIISMNNSITEQSNQITSINNTVEQHGNTINQHDNTISQQGNLISQQGNVIKQQGTKIETFDSDIRILNSGFKIQDGVLTGLSEIIVQDLETNTLHTKYATIDFSNIGVAAIEKLFTESGIIKDLIMSDGKVTGELVGVTIKGDLIEGNTIKADKLVVLGTDGLYYKLNLDTLGEATVESDEKYQNGLDGSVIIAKSITAEKVAVNDLVAFGATIGGYHIDEHSLYTGAKSSVDNTTRGIYLGDDGQIAIGDSNNYLKYYVDENGEFKLDLRFGGTTLDESINDLEGRVNNSINEAMSSVDNTINSLDETVTNLSETVNSKVSADDVDNAIKTELDKGVSRVTTSTGFSFNEEGLKISKNGSEMSTVLDEDGMVVKKNDEERLVANNEGVIAYDLHAKTYLIIGTNSRFEDYEKDGKKQTGCFWIGETEVE